jgi:oligopeptide/dipeptide ABC transporter ATP-binding protein
MYLGKLVELAPAQEIYSNPLHPYTQALLAAIPIPDPDARRESARRLGGDAPSPMSPGGACRFHTRCPSAMERCGNEEPELEEVAPGHFVACFLHEQAVQSTRG